MAGEKPPMVLKKGYRPPLPIRIFLDFLIEAVTNKNSRGWKVTLVVESFQLLNCLSILSTVTTGVILTKMFVDFDHTKIILDVVGFLNLCAYFDFPPTTYVTPLLYSFAIVFGTIYNIFSVHRLNVAYNEKKISSRARRLMTAAHMYYIVSAMWFGTIYATPPDRADPVTMRLHVLPYLNFKIAAVFLQCCIVWFGTKVAWNNIDFSSNKTKLFLFLSWLHFYLMIVETGFVVLIGLNGIGDMGPSGLVGKGLWWNVHNPPRFLKIESPLYGALGHFAMLLGIPIIQSMIIISKSFGHISKTQTVTFYIYDSISA